MEEWVSLAERSGLKGAELLKYVEERRAKEEERQAKNYERDERAAERELKRLEIERQAKSDEAERERQSTAEAAERERRSKAENAEQEIQKLELQKRLEGEEKALELRKLEMEQHKLELEMRAKAEAHSQALELQRIRHEQALELEKLKGEIGAVRHTGGSKSTSVVITSDEEEGLEENEQTSGRTINARKGPKLPPFEDGKDNMDSYLRRFEKYAAIRKWNRQEWALYLAALLKGRALDVYSRLPPEMYDNYDALKDALLKRYQLTEEGFRKRFHNCKPEAGESPQQFITRLDSYLMRWVELAKIKQDFEGLKCLLVKEQYLGVVSRELSLFLRERAPQDLQELAKLAEQYIEAHQDKAKRSYSTETTEASGKTEGKFFRSEANQEKAKPFDRNVKQNGSKDRRCFLCDRPGHYFQNCKFRQNTLHKAAGLQSSWKTRSRFSGQNRKSTVEEKEENPESTPVADKKKIQVKSTSNDVYKAGELGGCGSACQALENLADLEEVEFKCGCKAPVIADACRVNKSSLAMTTTKGYVGDKRIEVLRDTGCSSVVVARRLVNDNQMTGKYEYCILIDKSVRKVPTAIIDVKTEYFTGKVKALCMKETLYDLIIGNIPGAGLRPKEDDGTRESKQEVQTTDATDGTKEEEENMTLAVETRGMKAKAKEVMKPLHVPAFETNAMTIENLKKEQAEDQSLRKFWEYAQQEKAVGNKDERIVRFEVDRGLLYRLFRSEHHNNGNEVKQLVVPAQLRRSVMEIAHSSILGGHLGIHKTQDRVLTQFFWPGCYSDIARYCRSCDICQRTLPKGRVTKVPLIKMPIIDTVFKRCVVDLIGPLICSDRGYRYILTLVDCASRYPECIALKQIDTCSVAEALVSIFSRMGVPAEILTDNGSQFTGAMMKEVGRLLSIRQLVSTPYHSQNCGLVERYNGVIKQMLRKMCAEKVRDWDRYLDPLMFAYREVRNESTGFSPFELLYGKSVRGPMAILRELWTKEIAEPEVKTTYEYVVDLRNRLQETYEIAHENLKRAAEKYKRYFDKHAKPRKFLPGDKVLLLLPTESNKLQMQWKGPFEVLKCVGEADYLIQLVHRTKTFHANMLKYYYERPLETENTMNEEGEEAVQVLGSAVVIEEGSEMDMEETGDSHLPLFDHLQTETYKDVVINPELSSDQKREVEKLLKEFEDIFSNVPGRTNLVQHRINLSSTVPVRKRPYPVPYAMRKEMDHEIDEMIKLGVIEPSTAAYASPMLLVKKSDGTNRPCVDFRGLNRISVFDAEPMPRVDEIFAKLTDSQFFSKFDLAKGYWGIEVEPESRDYTSFITHRGLFRFIMMPFGLMTSPATFSRAMRKLLEGSSNLDNYLDDVLCYTREWLKHMHTLRDFFLRVRTAGLTLRPSKCRIGEKSVGFLGHTVGQGMVRPNADKIIQIAEATRPETKKQVRSYLGLVGYYRKFIPNFAIIAVPLTELTKKNQPSKVIWGEAQELAFQQLKKCLTSYPILRLPDWTREFILQTDASNFGAGAVLLQEMDGVKHPIAYISRKFLPRETRYSTIEREGLAIIWALQKLQFYLYGKHFWLETDHQPLIHLQRANPVNGRLMRWALILQQYNFSVRAIKGSENVGADYLSRQC